MWIAQQTSHTLSTPSARFSKPSTILLHTSAWGLGKSFMNFLADVQCPSLATKKEHPQTSEECSYPPHKALLPPTVRTPLPLALFTFAALLGTKQQNF